MLDDDRLAALRSWCEDREMRLAVLFGSVARGRQHQGSDVDLAVWPADVGPPRQKLTWLAELARLLGRETSLVFVTPRLDPVLGMEIVRHGRVVHEAEPGQWLAERSRLWHLYNDALPFRKALENRLAATARELRGA
jgi:predicted nucleotidyltransferase